MAQDVIGILQPEKILDKHVSPLAALSRAKLAQRANAPLAVNLLGARVWDAVHTTLPSAGASDDLGLITGTFGTAPPSLQTGDLKAAGATTRRCRLLVTVPEDYEEGQSVAILIASGMKTTIADVSATVDVEAYLLDDEGGYDGSDLVTDVAQSINSLSASELNFDLTVSSIVPGSVLDVRISLAVNDAATATAVIGCIYNIWLLADCR